jgi:hypothetical protein
MMHGRDHQERQYKVKARRASLPPEEELEVGRKRGMPRQRLIGAQTGRFEQPAERAKGGSEVAPTPMAEKREQVRHQEERMIGRQAAGVGENLRERRDRPVPRAKLEQAARMADQATAGRIPRSH